ncbi:acyl carrier protein [Mycobacterium spongiae]|nr:acyl carrier protein [Mycobacterium spongiae]
MTVIDTDSRKQVPATADTSRPLIGCPPGYQELTDWFTAKVARHINMAPEAIGLDTPLADYGLDSAASLQLCADLEYEKGIAVETTIMYDYATIDAIAEHLADPDASP